MLVYPEIESWGEFYPSEIFVSYDETDNTDEIFEMAPVGSTIYMGINTTTTSTTTIYKKVAEVKDGGGMECLIILGDINLN